MGSFVLALIGLTLCIAFARSMRGGSSGPLGSLLSIALVPLVGVDLWMMWPLAGWWTVLIFVAVSIVVGIAITRNNLASWVTGQPMTGIGMLISSCSAVALHFWR